MQYPVRPAALLVALLALPACGNRLEAPRDAVAGKETAGVPASAPVAADMAVASRLAGGAAEAEGSTLPNAAQDPALQSPMIIRTGQASVEVDSLELGMGQVQALAQRLGGFIANSQMQLGGGQYRAATLEVKIPAARWDELIGGITPLGKVEYVNVGAQDVGEEFTDVSARVGNARKLEGRLIELLGTRTGKLSDVLEIERELARVREEIERMEGRLRYLKAHAATSTLSITVHEPAPVIADGGSGGVIGEAFRQAWRNFVNFVAGFIASLGTLVPLGALGILALWVIRKVWQGRRPRS
ncbi:MAG: DUF4349 domain-containing protein [Gemmatimonadetes bacterium]|nr:DUF4349 domain-containing protein [Gemmatimonadota bacterium]